MISTTAAQYEVAWPSPSA